MVQKCIAIGLLPDTQNCGLRMRRECRELFPRHRLQRKTLVRDLGMHHGMCVTHVPWCMSVSLTRGAGENVTPAFPAHAQPAILRIWQEAHGYVNSSLPSTQYEVRDLGHLGLGKVLRVFGEALPDQMMTYFRCDPHEQTSVKSNQNKKNPFFQQNAFANIVCKISASFVKP